MSKKRILIGKEQIRDHYQVDDEGVVTQKHSDVTPVVDMGDYADNVDSVQDKNATSDDSIDKLSPVRFQFTLTRVANSWKMANQDRFAAASAKRVSRKNTKITRYGGYYEAELYHCFGDILDELRSDNPYGRWPSYQALQGQAWQRSESRKAVIDDFFLTIARQARVLANPMQDCTDLLRREHTRVTDLFHSNEYANGALYEARAQVINKILDQVWHKQADMMIPPGPSTWTIQELQTQPSYYWADDEIWTWADFWPKAQPLLDKYHQALDQLFILTKLQRLIRRCEQDSLKGYKQLIQPLRRKATPNPVTTSSPEKPVEASKPELVFKDLFTDPDEFDFCLSCLIQNDGQFTLINVKGEWIGRKNSISVLVAWIDQLQYYGKIKNVTRGRLAHLLNAYFQGINLGVEGRMFSNTNEIITKYKAHFRAMLLP